MATERARANALGGLERMRPLTIVVPLPPSYRGGTEEYAYRVAERVSRQLPVRLVTTQVRWGHDARSLSVGDSELIPLPAFELLERPIVTSGRARARLRSLVESSSVLHLHMPFPLVERWTTRWAVRSSVPVVLTYHMDAHLSNTRFGGSVTSLYRSLSARPALRRANRVVSNSLGYARASPVLSGFLGKVQIIPKGVDADRLGLDLAGPRDPPRCLGRDLPVDPSAFRIVFVGRLVPYKGVPVLLRAVKQLDRQGVRTHLYIAGRGPEEPRIRALIAHEGMQRLVTLLGFVPDEELGQLLRWADVVACPSLNMLESTPTSLEEAASLGTPVLGSDLPGARESIPSDGVRGLLVAPGQPDAVAAGLARLRAAPRPAPPAHPRTWDDVAADYLAVYRILSPELGG